MVENLDLLDLSALIDWLGQHPQWITITIGAAAFIESLAMIGVIVPGVALLYGCALLAGGAELSVYSCLIAAFIGAVTGDLISFALGRYAHQPALRCWPFRQHPDWLAHGEHFIDRYGTLSVVIGRFVGPIRPVLPFVAGMLQMAPMRFISINLLSALLWAPVYILPGYWLGRLGRESHQHWDQLDPNGLLNLLLLGLLLLIPLSLFIGHRWLHPDQPRHQQLTLWLRLEQLRSPRSDERPLASMLLALSAATGLLLLSVAVAAGNPLAPLDQGLTTLVQTLRTPALDRWVIAITMFGDGWLLGLLSSILVLVLLGQRQPAAALHWSIAIVLVLGLNTLLKQLFQIDRPELLLQPLSSYSFPSGHTSGATLFYTLLASFIAQQRSYHRRWPLYAIACVPAGLVGLSRIYLGVHWFSDVLGGVLLGLLLSALIRLSYSRYDRQPVDWRHPGLWLALAVAIGGYLLLGFDGELIRYQLASSVH